MIDPRGVRVDARASVSRVRPTGVVGE